MKIIKYNILGVSVAKLTKPELLNVIKYSVDFNKKLVIAYQNLHGLYLTNKNNMLKLFAKDAINLIDGMPLISIGRMLKYDLEKTNRLAWIDFTGPLLELASENRWKIYYLGTSEETVTNVKEKAKKLYNLEITGRNGFFDASPSSPDSENIVNQINAVKPDMLIVGMSMPRQEIWILNNKDRINTKLIMTCGAAFEFFSGTAKIPPRWLGNIGLEWLYRFIENPGKLWFRYTIEPWYILKLLIKSGNLKEANKSYDI